MMMWSITIVFVVVFAFYDDVEYNDCCCCCVCIS